MRQPGGIPASQFIIEQDGGAEVRIQLVAQTVILTHTGNRVRRGFYRAYDSDVFVLMPGHEDLLADRAVAPVRKFGHPFHETPAYDDFGSVDGRTPFDETDTQQIKEIVRNEILVGVVEQLPVIVGQIDVVAGRMQVRELVGTGDAPYFRQVAQSLDSKHLRIPVSVEQVDMADVLAVIARIEVGHLFVLSGDDEHHHHQEHVDQHLDAQQAELPLPGMLRVVLQRRMDRNALVEFSGHHDGDGQDEQDEQRDGHDAARHKQGCERHAQQVLDETPAGENDGGGQREGQEDVHQGLFRQQGVDILAPGTIAFAHAHFPGALDQRRNDDEDIIEQGNQNQQHGHDGEQD